jgi:hypothetical protein
MNYQYLHYNFFTIKRLLNPSVGYYDYIWQEVALLKQTPKAMLITFAHPNIVKIKISEYNWSRKFG